MRVSAIPACGVDWRREFALPAAVPPESLGAAQRLEYVQALNVTGELLHNTYEHFVVQAPGPRQVRAAPPGAASRLVLPRDSGAASDELTLPPAADAVVSAAPFNARTPQPGTAAEVEAELAATLPVLREVSDAFGGQPLPRSDFDTVKLTFDEQAAAGFAGTLGVDEPGLLGEASVPAAVPPLLLETRTRGATTEIGELDRLLLRAPVTGRFRFEPYVHYRWNPPTFTVEGASASGRLVVEQPLLAARRSADHNGSQMFGHRLFTFDHVDRTFVAWLVHNALVLQVAYLSQIDEGFRLGAAVEPRLKIPAGSEKAFTWVLDAVNALLRCWTAYLSVLRWRPEDGTVAGELPAAWSTRFGAREMKKSDAAALVADVTALLAKPTWWESLRFFSRQVYAPRLAGHSWLEVLEANGQQAARRFPVPSDQPPFSTHVQSEIRQHLRLRTLEDPRWRWVACYAGAPIGRPSRAYLNGLSTYELEALHAAGTAHTELGLPAAIPGPGPRPGRAMDLTGYAPQADGHACTFAAQRVGRFGLQTTADWLLELTRGLHFLVEENGFIDLPALMDPADGTGHPLLAALRVDQQLKARHLRRQMDALAATTLAGDSLTWWDGVVGFASDVSGTKWHHVDAAGNNEDAAPSPAEPYRDSRTRLPPPRPPFPGVLAFSDLGAATVSGFDGLDLESAYLACARMADPPDDPGQLPLAVLLALMEREGIKVHAAINRRVTEAVSEPETLTWIAYPATAARAEWPPADAQMARAGWLLYPYGLDTFAFPKTDAEVPHLLPTNDDAAVNTVVGRIAAAGVVDLAGEDLARYVRERVRARFLPAAPLAGAPHIWKLTRRAHWAGLSFMAGFFRLCETQVAAPSLANRLAVAGWSPDPGWGTGPPSLAGKTPTDPEWKDYLSWYGLVYLLYNTSPRTWRTFVRDSEAARGGSPLSLRDWLLFKQDRVKAAIGHMVRFVVGLDAFLRLDYMDGRPPSDYPAAAPDTTAAAGRAWGVP